MQLIAQPARISISADSRPGGGGAIRFDPDVLKAARAKATAEDQTLADYIEALIRQDLRMGAAEPSVKVVGPENLRSSNAVAVPGETQDERQRRDDVFFAILDASGHGREGPV